MKNEVKHRWVKYYLVIALIIGISILVSASLKISWVHLHPIDNILGLLFALFIVSFPVVGIIYAFNKNKQDRVIALFFFNGLQWLIYIGCLYLFLLMD